MPGQLGTLELIGSIEGPEALAQVSRLHGTDIELVSAYIAEYAHGGERVTVWVGIAESSSAGAELTREMVQAIEKGGGSGFGNLQRLTIAGQDVFQVVGAGGEHFFYNPEEPKGQIVWLTVEAADPLGVLEQALRTF